MKKTISLMDDKKILARLIEGAKYDVKKYIKRERNKDLPEGVDYWDFDCKYGPSEDSAEVIHLSEINKYIDQAEEQALKSFYIEVVAKHGVRGTK